MCREARCSRLDAPRRSCRNFDAAGDIIRKLDAVSCKHLLELEKEWRQKIWILGLCTHMLPNCMKMLDQGIKA